MGMSEAEFANGDGSSNEAPAIAASYESGAFQSLTDEPLAAALMSRTARVVEGSAPPMAQASNRMFLIRILAVMGAAWLVSRWVLGG
jgi:hypothetical protein